MMDRQVTAGRKILPSVIDISMTNEAFKIQARIRAGQAS